MVVSRPLINRCARPARPAPPTHSPRRRAAQPDPERRARAGRTALPTSGWAAVFGFMGMGKSLPRCRCCHLSCCRPQHSIYLWNPIYNCRCIRARRQACQGICLRACDPSSDLGRVHPNKLLLLSSDNSLREVRCAALCSLPCSLAHAHRIACCHLCCSCLAGCGCTFAFDCRQSGWRLISHKFKSGVLPQFHGALLAP